MDIARNMRHIQGHKSGKSQINEDVQVQLQVDNHFSSSEDTDEDSVIELS